MASGERRALGRTKIPGDSRMRPRASTSLPLLCSSVVTVPVRLCLPQLGPLLALPVVLGYLQHRAANTHVKQSCLRESRNQNASYVNNDGLSFRWHLM